MGIVGCSEQKRKYRIMVHKDMQNVIVSLHAYSIQVGWASWLVIHTIYLIGWHYHG